MFHPLTVLLCSVAVATLYAAYMLSSLVFRNSMFTVSGTLAYVVPIVVPFVAFLFDRAERWGQTNAFHHVTDLVVVAIAIGRVVAHVPFISGHTIFLTYALLSTHSKVLSITAALVMLHAAYLKYVVWDDFTTSTAGIVLGIIAALLVARWGQKPAVLEPNHSS